MILTNPLKDLDQLHASEETKEKTLQYVLSKQRHKKTLPIWQGALVCAISVLLVMLWQSLEVDDLPTNPTSPAAIASTITLDVNPSMELSVDAQHRILQTKAYNKDAKQILASIDLKNKELDEALTLLFANATYQKYLANGILEVGIYADDAALQKSLEEEIGAYLKSNATAKRYHCASIDSKTHEAAKMHHTSQGKYRVIEQIRSYDAAYTIEELSNYSMKNLYALLEQYDDSAVPEGCHSERAHESNQETHHQNRHHGNHD